MDHIAAYSTQHNQSERLNPNQKKKCKNYDLATN